MNSKLKNRRSVMKMLKLRNACRESHVYRPSVRRNSRRSFFRIRSLSIISATLNRSCFAKRFINLLVTLRRTSFSKKNVNSKRTKKRRSCKIN